MLRLLVLCTILYLSLAKKASSTVIKLSQGLMRGHDRDSYISYEGIPYASGGARERFKKAGPPPSWASIRESYRVSCSLTSPVSECLQLDVHVPKVKSGLIPVFAWVKGGSGFHNPEKLVEQGILVVIISHRFGLEGFLCSNDELIPGNAGMKDVVLALRWIRDNIVAFRGSPSHVVVGGQSFGAAMVEALTLSTQTENLYRGVIMQSGSVLSPWAFHYDARDKTMELGKSFEGSNPIINLINASPKNLTEKATMMKFSYHSFGICMEKIFKKEEQFLSAPPYSLLSHGRIEVIDDVPMLMGYNNDEANIFLPALQSAKVQNKIYLNPLILLPLELNITTMTRQQQRRTLVQMLRLYFERNTTFSLPSLLAYHRDAYFLNHIHRSARLHASLSVFPVFYYQFSYSKNKVLKNYGAGHSDEMAYLFPKMNKVYEGTDSVVQKNLITLWSNFIKFLDPTPDKSTLTWEPLDLRSPKVYDINKKMKMKEFPFKSQMQFWDELYQKLYYPESISHKYNRSIQSQHLNHLYF